MKFKIMKNIPDSHCISKVLDNYDPDKIDVLFAGY